MSPTVWAVTFGGTLLAAATIIAYAACRAAVREDREAEAFARVQDILNELTAAQDETADAVELAYLRGAVAALHKAADALAAHPDMDADDALRALRKMADHIILDRPAVWS